MINERRTTHALNTRLSSVLNTNVVEKMFAMRLKLVQYMKIEKAMESANEAKVIE